MRAEPSGVRLTANDAALVKGMIERGDRHHDIAAWFGVNQGRVAEVGNGEKFSDVPQAPTDQLPPPGPYTSGRSAHKAICALEAAKKTLLSAVDDIDSVLKDVIPPSST